MEAEIYQRQTVPNVGRVSMFANVPHVDKCMNTSSYANLTMEKQYKI